MLATVATGGTSAIFTKGFIKPAQGGITSIHRDIDNFVLGRHKKPLSVRESVLCEVLVDGQVEGVLEEIHGVVGVESYFFCNFLDENRISIVLSDVGS